MKFQFHIPTYATFNVQITPIVPPARWYIIVKKLEGQGSCFWEVGYFRSWFRIFYPSTLNILDAPSPVFAVKILPPTKINIAQNYVLFVSRPKTLFGRLWRKSWIIYGPFLCLAISRTIFSKFSSSSRQRNITTSASISILPDSLRSESCGLFWPPLVSTARFSWKEQDWHFKLSCQIF